uniref:Uncharacterized protein n=1 Tax=Anguilla anguilla TaxID=7936 RepID=A0A0E9P7F2_ANGAN
MGNISLLAS